MARPRAPAVPPSEDRVDEQARQGDARLVRRVRWRLVLFSGGTTLLILLALGALLYIRVASSLETTGVAQLDARASALKRPVKWFSLAEFFRYERMQKGRGRCFHQFNADILKFA